MKFDRSLVGITDLPGEAGGVTVMKKYPSEKFRYHCPFLDLGEGSIYLGAVADLREGARIRCVSRMTAA